MTRVPRTRYRNRRRPAFLIVLVLAAIISVGAFMTIMAHAAAEVRDELRLSTVRRTARLAAVSAATWIENHADQAAGQTFTESSPIQVDGIAPPGVTATAEVKCTPHDGDVQCTILGRARDRRQSARFEVCVTMPAPQSQ